jgi:hypothetical protein
MFRPVGSLPVDVADELRQINVPQRLSDGEVFPGVIPVMIDHPEDK